MIVLFFSIPRLTPQHRMTRARPAPRKSYVILFTARSGSSWLTDQITQCETLGSPNEYFNRHFIPNIARRLKVCDMPDYVNLLTHTHQSNGVFGTEITAHQINASFENDVDLVDFFQQPAGHGCCAKTLCFKGFPY